MNTNRSSLKDAFLFPAHPVLLHGGDYNPDQWLDRPDIIERDMELMERSGCTTFSLGVFAWSRLEQPDGAFTMDWLQAMLDRLHQHGRKVLLATPSGAKPIWLARRYPEICRVDKEGNRAVPRGRHNHCLTSPVFRRAIERIDSELASRFGQHPAIVGWHVGNELSGACWCELCLEAFRGWLRNRFDTVEELNRAMWSDFWGHRFADWGDVFVQDPCLDGIALEWRRFSSQQLVDFVRFEIDVLRRSGAQQPATTNLMGFYPDMDPRSLAPHVDLIADDVYPEYYGGAEQVYAAVQVSLSHDLMRSLKMRSFLQMESSPSFTNWQRLAHLKRPGVHRLEMLQALAHGADGTMYFQWRAGRGAHEKWHGAVVDHSGTEQTRVFQEVRAHSDLLRRLDGLPGARSRNQVAVLCDWETRWALETSCLPSGTGKDRGFEKALHQCVRPLWERGIGIDLRARRDDLSQYRLVVIPQGYLFSEDDAGRLMEYVRAGGVVLATWLLARVGETNLCHLGGFPGAGLRRLFGVWAEELDQPAEADTVSAIMPDGGSWPVRGLIDRCHLEGAEPVAVLQGGSLHDGKPALTRHVHGKGRAWYWAAQAGTIEGADAVMDCVLKDAGVAGLTGTVQRGFTVQSRTNGRHTWFFALNFNDAQAATWEPPQGCIDIESREACAGHLVIPPLGSRILMRETPAGDVRPI